MKGCWNCKAEHRLHIETAAKGLTAEAKEVCVVRGGTGLRPYLRLKGVAFGSDNRLVTVSGRKLLRQIALAILAELGDDKP